MAESLCSRGNSYKENIKYLIETATKNNLDIAIVTNGYTIVEYLDIIKQGKIREIQVTLDGTEHIHNQRRILKDSSPTFAKIANWHRCIA